tara:strand:- start:1849 stop:2244 length:396 start_codon:yes stop_codon:yes gene_type:complete
MSLEIPDSMDDCLYFTRRVMDDGKVMCWVEKETCKECNKGLMGKPRGDDGKVKIRAKEYVCPDCKHTVEKKEYEETLTASIIYTCPECKHSGDTQVPFKRKKIKGADILRFQCESCNADIDIAKKFKKKKE